MNINLTKKQTKAWDFLTDDVTTELGYGGAARGGKSWLGATFFIFMCLAYPKTRWAIGRRELKNLKRTTLLTFFKACAEYGLSKDVHFNYNEMKGAITFRNGSEIYLLDLANQPSDPLYTWLGGFEITGAWVDESNEIPEIGIQILKSRCGNCLNDEYNLKPLLLETFNPNKGHVYKRYYKPFKDEKLPEYRQFVSALPTDNPYIPQSYIDELKRADKITRERLLYGNFEYDDDPACLFEFDSIQDLFTNKAEKSDEKYLCADIARFGDDKTVIHYWEGLKRVKGWTLAKKSTKEVADFIKQKAEELQVRRSHIVIDEDGIGGGVVDQIDGCKGFTNNAQAIQPYDSKWDDAKKVNYTNLKTQCYFRLADLANQGKIQIANASEEEKTEIAEELEQIKQADIDNDGKIKLIKKEKMKEGLGRSPDNSDTLMMRMFFELSDDDVDWSNLGF